MRILRFLPEVDGDLANAGFWYWRKGGTELEERFVNDFYASAAQVVPVAESTRLIGKNLRRFQFNYFPHMAYYRLTEEAMVVVLVIHTSRNPQRVSRLLRRRIPK